MTLKISLVEIRGELPLAHGTDFPDVGFHVLHHDDLLGVWGKGHSTDGAFLRPIILAV